ncbi:hypothetical protein KP509_08G047400 [Ceratopteris richardii]|uniref:Uncharacterized protein n=1 Tax=Ceratopteris richardii TaxID=49495 RepID=A0A8T2UBZ3_CERRI|nr:hypothetical protein KP509_08G047400 [Ceratopteris richardii]
MHSSSRTSIKKSVAHQDSAAFTFLSSSSSFPRCPALHLQPKPVLPRCTEYTLICLDKARKKRKGALSGLSMILPLFNVDDLWLFYCRSGVSISMYFSAGRQTTYEIREWYIESLRRDGETHR